MDKPKHSPLIMTLDILRHASKASNARIWRSIAISLSSTRKRHAEINIGKIAKLAMSGAAVVIPGKVLGSGLLSHSLMVGAWSFSDTARKKITDAGGKALTIADFVQEFPDGKGVVVLGG
ncbi:MAG: 50S ribosomal protein L18e [Thaumarchaeota archaeon]|mgnify:CR=1 FL=1|nr:50S ribosomal protein L18e [Nitrososphaerota archaeon]